jgi:hypothetical protein
VNDFVAYVSSFALPGVLEQLKRASAKTWAVCFDLVASFFQCPLDDDVQPYFCFLGSDGMTYAFKRMVMGFGPSCEIMETILQILVHETMKAFPSVEATTFVDNVRFMDDTADTLSRVAVRFREVCTEAGVSLNTEECNIPHQDGIFLGVHFDYALGTSGLTDKTRKKLRRARMNLFEPQANISDVFQAFGLLFFASSVVGYNLSTKYHIFKFYRRKAHAFSSGAVRLTDPAFLWNCIKKELGTWFSELDDVLLLQRLRSPSNGFVSLFSDASKSGAGATVFTENGHVWVWSRPWSALEASRHITELEALACHEAISYFRGILQGKKVRIYVDNTSVLGAATRGYSPSFHFNKYIGPLYSLLKELSATLNYIRSDQNPADEPSRCSQLRR